MKSQRETNKGKGSEGTRVGLPETWTRVCPVAWVRVGGVAFQGLATHPGLLPEELENASVEDTPDGEEIPAAHGKALCSVLDTTTCLRTMSRRDRESTDPGRAFVAISTGVAGAREGGREGEASSRAGGDARSRGQGGDNAPNGVSGGVPGGYAAERPHGGSGPHMVGSTRSILPHGGVPYGSGYSGSNHPAGGGRSMGKGGSATPPEAMGTSPAAIMEQQRQQIEMLQRQLKMAQGGTPPQNVAMYPSVYPAPQ